MTMELTTMTMMTMWMDMLPLNGDWLVTMSSFLGGGALGGWISAGGKENRRIKRSEVEECRTSRGCPVGDDGNAEPWRTWSENAYNESNAESLRYGARADQLNIA